MFRIFSKSAKSPAPTQPSKNHPDINDALVNEASWYRISDCFDEDKYTVTQIKNALSTIQSKAWFAAGAGDIWGNSRFDQKFLGFLYRLKDKHPNVWKAAEESIHMAIDMNILNGKFNVISEGCSAFIEGSPIYNIFEETIAKRLVFPISNPINLTKLTLADLNDKVLYFSYGDWKHQSADQCVRHWLSYGGGIDALIEIVDTVKRAEEIHKADPRYFKGITGEFQKVMDAIAHEQENLEKQAKEKLATADKMKNWAASQNTPSPDGM